MTGIARCGRAGCRNRCTNVRHVERFISRLFDLICLLIQVVICLGTPKANTRQRSIRAELLVTEQIRLHEHFVFRTHFLFNELN